MIGRQSGREVPLENKNERKQPPNNCQQNAPRPSHAEALCRTNPDYYLFQGYHIRHNRYPSRPTFGELPKEIENRNKNYQIVLEALKNSSWVIHLPR